MSEEQAIKTARSLRPRRPGVFIGFALAGVLLLSSAALLMLRRGPEPVTVGEVVRSIRETVLAGHHAPDEPRAGIIGPWNVAAESFDSGTLTFRNFRLETDSLMVSAERARLSIDVEASSFTFHLEDVRLLPLPVDPDASFESTVTSLATYELGPVPLRSNVVLDPAKPRRMPIIAPPPADNDPAAQRRASVFDDLSQ